MKHALASLLVVLSAFLLSLIAGILSVAQNDWFGSGDLSAYSVYCFPFSVLLAGVAFLFFKISYRWPSWLGVTVAFTLGIFTGYLSTFIVALLLGPWFGAMSVPMLKSWCVAAALFIPAFYLVAEHGWSRSSIIGNTVLIGIGSALFFGIAPLMSLATGNQHLMTAFFQYVPGEQELRIEQEPEWLSEDDHRLILSCGLKGTLKCFSSGGSNSTRWPQAKAFVIFTSDLTEATCLRQPKHTSVLYVQREHEFTSSPKDAKFFKRAIEFYKDQGEWYYSIEQSSGAKSGGWLGL